MSKRIFLVGLPGSGKTTLGMELANHLNIQFYDLDQEIEKPKSKLSDPSFQKKERLIFAS